MLSGCKTQSNSVTSSQSDTMEQIENKTSDCPEEGKCTFVAHRNSNLEIKKDGIGKLYPQIVDGDNIVIQYTYLKEAPEGIADGNYSESIYFQIPKDSKKLTKEGTSLADVNLLFGRHYFSPESGFFLIDSGKLSVENTGDLIHIDLQFKMDNGRQVISHIVETIESE